MREYSRGDVLLISFPLSDLSDIKRRPALVVLDTGDEDVLVARVTSQEPRSAYDVELHDWRDAGLLLPSIVRLDKLATLKKNLTVRTLGRLSDSDLERVESILRGML
jgi:mRNA interferase MazF